MLEVEVKYRAADRDAVLVRLLALGADLAEERVDVDHYFNAPDRDFKQTDEAFRLRQIGKANWLTYKGPKREAATKTRKEVEVRLRDGDAIAADMEALLVCLGYRPVAVVRKRRAIYDLDRPVGGKPGTAEVCFDDVDRVGSFVEIEVQAEESEFEAAKATVLGIARELGLTDQERRSYLEMLLANS
ncbi:MAG TPA: class IV adenylate cyclase [Gemmataceae bacterium]|nr:class IV adenylate cyclase [Gemmataceae bacterium]